MFSYFFSFLIAFFTLLTIGNTENAFSNKTTKNQNFNMQIKQSDTTGIIAAGATLQLVSNQFAFTEGPAVDKAGNLFFTDQPNDKIWQCKLDGSLSVFLEKSGRSNGLYLDTAGNIIACADEKNEVWCISPSKKITVLYQAPESRRLNGPNDLWIDAAGGIYLTDPYYQRPYWTRKKPVLEKENVYYLPHGKKKLMVVDDKLKQPNGIVGTPDGRHLFVADIGDNKTYKYEIQPDGRLKNRTLFVEKGSDGMTLDANGNLYITGDGVTVFDADGKEIEHIAVPAKWTGNVCFAGKDKETLFITASEALYTLQMNVAGVE